MERDVPPSEEPESNDDDAEDIPPPEARRVAARCGVLVSLAYRAFLEGRGRREKREAARRKVIAWAGVDDVDDELEPKERAMLEPPIGRLSAKDRRHASWLVESAVVMAWALGLIELPTYDEQVAGERVASAIRFLEDPWTVPEEAQLRNPGEIADAFASTLALHWRLRQWGRDPVPMDFASFVARCSWGHLSTKGLVLRDGDLLLRGRPLAEAGETLFECRSIAQERNRAFQWLLGDNAVLWSQVTADT